MSIMPTQFELLHYLNYDEKDGSLTWRERVPSMFLNGAHSAEHQAAKWNSAYAGHGAIIFGNNGYGYTTINAKKYLSHRIIWKIKYNTEPEQIDHVSGDKTNNRLENLRPVNRFGNMQNMKRPKHNTSGTIGVSYRKDRGVWRAYIMVNKKSISLGHFSTMEAAIAARDAASTQYGYHANHGR